MVGHGSLGARCPRKARAVGHVHVVACPVDGKEDHVDLPWQIRKDLGIIKGISRDVIDLPKIGRAHV